MGTTHLGRGEEDKLPVPRFTLKAVLKKLRDPQAVALNHAIDIRNTIPQGCPIEAIVRAKRNALPRPRVLRDYRLEVGNIKLQLRNQQFVRTLRYFGRRRLFLWCLGLIEELRLGLVVQAQSSVLSFKFCQSILASSI